MTPRYLRHLIERGISNCLLCQHFDLTTSLKCKAFPVRIPSNILSGEMSHIKSLPDDKGFQFKPVKDFNSRLE